MEVVVGVVGKQVWAGMLAEWMGVLLGVVSKWVMDRRESGCHRQRVRRAPCQAWGCVE